VKQDATVCFLKRNTEKSIKMLLSVDYQRWHYGVTRQEWPVKKQYPMVTMANGVLDIENSLSNGISLLFS
jgi:predicted transcriptional regulator